MLKIRVLGALFLIFAFTLSIVGQEPFNGQYLNNDLKIKLMLNLYKNNIPVPGFELDSCYGYLQGSLNGSWIILKVKSVDANRAEVRAVSERGSDAQDLLLVYNNEGGTIIISQQKEANIKGVKGRKYIKLPKDMVFEKL